MFLPRDIYSGLGIQTFLSLPATADVVLGSCSRCLFPYSCSEQLFKEGIEPENVKSPVDISAAGLTRERLTYLYKFIRPFVRVSYKDAVAPSPDAEE